MLHANGRNVFEEDAVSQTAAYLESFDLDDSLIILS